MSPRILFPALLFATALLHAQQPITLDAVVIPKSGQPIPNLQQGDFTLLDNKAPRPLTSFKALTAKQAPAEVIIVVDAVNTSYQNVAFERDQINKFLRAREGQLEFPTALAIFTDTGTQIQQGFSTDGNAQAKSLDDFTIGLRTLRRSSGFYGATDRFDLSVTALRQLIAREAPRPGRKIIVWISPGWPLLSGPGIELDNKQRRGIFASVVALSTELRQGRITLDSIDPLGASDAGFRTFYYQEFVKGVSKDSQVDIGDLGLQVLATQSGGLAITGNNDVTAQLQRCVRDLDAYYEFSFDPPPAEHANEYHHLELQVTQPGLAARTRDGYYAQP